LLQNASKQCLSSPSLSSPSSLHTWQSLSTLTLKKKKKKKLGDLYSVYPALPGGSRRWEQSVLPG
jgi:hypothetical protein